jgi:hypothetical protein
VIISARMALRSPPRPAALWQKAARAVCAELRAAPAVRRLAVQPPIAAAAKLHRVVFHHLGQGCDPSRQAEALEARAHSLPGIGYQRRRIDGLRCAILLHGVAFLRGFDTPSLQAQGGQRRPTYFNISQDIPDCPRLVAEAYLARDGDWRLRPLLAVTTAPTFRPDMSIIETPGYDTATGLLFNPLGVRFAQVPERPDKEEARKALASIKRLFRFAAG